MARVCRRPHQNVYRAWAGARAGVEYVRCTARCLLFFGSALYLREKVLSFRKIWVDVQCRAQFVGGVFEPVHLLIYPGKMKIVFGRPIPIKGEDRAEQARLMKEVREAIIANYDPDYGAEE